MSGPRRIRIRSEEMGQVCTVDIDRMEYVLDGGRRQPVGDRFRRGILEAFARHGANQTQFGSPSNNEYTPASGSGHPNGGADPSTIPRSSDGDNDQANSRSGSDESGEESDESSDAQSQDNARTPDRGPSPPVRSTGPAHAASQAALERRRLLTRLIRERRVPVGDAIAVADLVEEGHDDLAAIQIHALIKSGQDHDVAVRIPGLMDNGHPVEDAIAIANLIEQGHDDDVAVRIHDLMRSGQDHDAAVRISELVDEGHPPNVAIQARALEEDGRAPGMSLAMALLMVRGVSEEAAEATMMLRRRGIAPALATRIGRLRDTGSPRSTIDVIGGLLVSNYTLAQAIRIAQRTEEGMGLAAAIAAEDEDE